MTFTLSRSDGKVALVTAASQGIGESIARELASRGYRLALMARSEAILSIGKELDAVALQGDIRDVAALEQLVAATLERYGRIDAVVNNTGHPPKGDLLELTDADWATGHELILASVVRTARLIIPVMFAQGSGAIVSVSSFAAVVPSLDRPVSSVYRAALSAWTKVCAEYSAAKGVRVNSVLPGFVDSYQPADSDIAAIPMGRVGRLGELARFVAFLLSDEASYITGQNLLIDGGLVRAI
jgi:NAD(P)-dependent dehydrogenase (short-subunit alcohol dehydrogenase family)